MGPNKLCAVLLLALICHAVDGASILALFSSLSYSDHLIFKGYISRLAQKGYSIVVMTPYPGYLQEPEVEKIVELNVGQDSAPFWEEYKILMANTDDYFLRLRSLNEFSLRLAIAQLRSKQMTALLVNPNIKFDLVISEADVPLLYAVAEKYEAGHISITTSSGRIHQHEAKGNPTDPVRYPDVNSLNYNNLTTWEKLIEYYRHFQTRNEYWNNYLPLSNLAAKKIFKMKRNLIEVERDIDLLFIAHNPFLAGIRPTVPGTVYIDRMHIKPGFALPQDLQRILDNATNGVVYFSLGVIQESETLSETLLNTLTEAFRDLPFTVLWKIGNTSAISLPDNVVAHAWFPQQEVLAHPNVKAFITNGGARSLEEALYYEVPIIGLPIVKSRRVFIKEITELGAGEILDPYYLNKESMKNVVLDVVTKYAEYKEAIVKLKHRVFNPLISGPEEAMWWTDYLLTHGKIGHLHSYTAEESFWSYYKLHVYSYLFAFFLCFVSLMAIILRRILEWCYEQFFRITRAIFKRIKVPFIRTEVGSTSQVVNLGKLKAS